MRVSVIALMNVATSAHRIAVAAPSAAARRTGEPLRPTRARMAAAPPAAMVAPIQAELVGAAFPPVGSDTATKSARDPHVMAAAHQVTVRIC